MIVVQQSVQDRRVPKSLNVNNGLKGPYQVKGCYIRSESHIQQAPSEVSEGAY